jgi:putative solute:sodium symporter small subunit
VSAPLTETQRRYWRMTLRVTALLLAVWFVVTFGVAFFARDLNFVFFGWPFSFWVAAQGGPLIYVVLIGVYAWRMNRLDREHGVAEDE